MGIKRREGKNSEVAFFYPSKIEQQADATPLGFFERISTCDASLRKRQQQIHDRATASSDPSQLPPPLLLPPLGSAAGAGVGGHAHAHETT